MLIGIVGKPSSGKSTLLNSMCMTDAKMGNYPFTTIKPNRGVAYVVISCPCQKLSESCNPRSGKCEDGQRYVPIEILDVAGLVPGASEGKGMGNQFLDDLRTAKALIHVVDSSGTTDEEGNQSENYNPMSDIKWLGLEIQNWIHKILFDNWTRVSRKLEQDPTKVAETILERLSGLGANLVLIKKAIQLADLLGVNATKWDEIQQMRLSKELRSLLFPMIVAANKMDMSNSMSNIAKMKENYSDIEIFPVSALAELTLRKAMEDNLINYNSKEGQVNYLIDDSENNRIKVVKAIEEKILNVNGSTGVNQVLDYSVFELLNLIAVYPVENQNKLCDKDGRVLPDVFLVEKGTTAKEFAGKIHTDLADKFINGILIADVNKAISGDHELNNGDVMKINTSS